MNADALLDTGSGTPLSTNAFAYCENNYTNFVDFNGMAAISSKKRTPDVIRLSIENSLLNEKSDSIDELKVYNSKSVNNGVIIYTFTKMLGAKQYHKSTYYLMKKTENGWIKYANNRWKVKVSFVKGVGFFCEIFSFHEDPRLQLIGTVGSYLASKYVPRGVNTILNQLVSSNYYKNKYYICFKVINRYFSKSKKGWYCYHEKTYSLW